MALIENTDTKRSKYKIAQEMTCIRMLVTMFVTE